MSRPAERGLVAAWFAERRVNAAGRTRHKVDLFQRVPAQLQIKDVLVDDGPDGRRPPARNPAGGGVGSTRASRVPSQPSPACRQDGGRYQLLEPPRRLFGPNRPDNEVGQDLSVLLVFDDSAGHRARSDRGHQTLDSSCSDVV